MSPELWAIIGVGVAGVGLHWRALARIDALNVRIDALQSDMDRRLSDLDRRLARIEGWIAGRFREETAQPLPVKSLPTGTVSFSIYAGAKLT